MIKLELDIKKDEKVLLAFSGGIDSTALFFLLLKNNINFDIAIVNYNLRKQAKDEVTYAKELAQKYNKQCFVEEVNLENYSNFEKKARDIRYEYFTKIIKSNSYSYLLTAHQLDDKLEWFLMQLSRGAGLVELLGLQACEKKENYTLLRPLLKVTKEELETYLITNNHKYFIDKTNYDTKYRRNYFRKNYSNPFINEFKNGVNKSFEYLNNDLKSLDISYDAIIKKEELEVFLLNKDENINIRVIDKSLKKRGFLLSKKTRDEILNKKEVVVSHKVSIAISLNYIFISPFSKKNMDKEFKERCRELKIPKKIRAYLFEKNINLKFLAIL